MLGLELNAESNKVTLEQLENLLSTAQTEECIFFGGKSLVVVYQLGDRGNFTLVAQSSVVDKSTFDVQTGREICKQDAIRQLWWLEGYRLQLLLEPNRTKRPT